LKKIYILILFFACISFESFSQNSNSASYFPLQVGNKWFYERFHTPAAVYTYLEVSISKDTIANGKTYFYVDHFPEQPDYWVRYDTTDGILYYFGETEVPLFKLSATIGDTTNYICSAWMDTTFFNTSTHLKKFYKQYNTPHSSSGTQVQLAKYFGQTYYHEYSASFTGSSYISARLKGCIINGITYGDTTFPIGIVQSSNQIPSGFSLSQNYPNPFNPTTQISFDISKASLVNLVVYDGLGRGIEKVVNQQLSPGSYKYEWDASSYPSGIYFYKLQAGSFVQTKKMILQK